MLICLFLFVSLYRSSRLPRIFAALLPTPRSIQLLSTRTNVRPRSVMNCYLGGGTRVPFHRSCFPQGLLGSIHGNAVLLGVSGHVGRRRNCQLVISSKGIAIRTHARIKLRCNIRALMRLTRGTMRLGASLPTFRVGSCPSDSCHTVRVSLGGRVGPGSCLCRVLSHVTRCGLGTIIMRCRSGLGCRGCPRVTLPSTLSMRR